jgi:hypothetical protein
MPTTDIVVKCWLMLLATRITDQHMLAVTHGPKA